MHHKENAIKINTKQLSVLTLTVKKAWLEHLWFTEIKDSFVLVTASDSLLQDVTYAVNITGSYS